MFAIRSASMVATMSLYGNSSASLDSGNECMKSAFQDLLASIPYISAESRSVEEERNHLAKLYMALKRNFDRMTGRSEDGAEGTGQDNGGPSEDRAYPGSFHASG